MSLVNEALKRARAQAAIQHAANAPHAQVAAPVHYSEPKRSVVPIALALCGGCVLVTMACAAIVYVGRARTEIAPVAASIPASSLAAQTPLSAVQPRVSLPPPPAQTAAPEPPVAVPAPTDPVLSQASAPAATPGMPPAQSPSGGATSATSTSAVAAPPAPPVPALVEGKVYLQALDLPEGPKVKLDGILWSDKNPVALINGISAAPGDDLDGLTVVAIEPKRVKLAARGKEFFVRLP